MQLNLIEGKWIILDKKNDQIVEKVNMPTTKVFPVMMKVEENLASRKEEPEAKNLFDVMVRGDSENFVSQPSRQVENFGFRV